MELLMVNYLAQNNSMIVHACGIDYEGKGILFVGESGAGKSTLTKIWNKENGVDILSDDRIIIRKDNDQYWIYGTPWHGDARFASPAKVKLEKIFFIKHGRANSIKTVGGSFPVLQFLKASFPPYWDKNCMQFTMEFFHDLVAVIPCLEMSFVPDSKVVGFVKSIKD
jgi:energy-coupling factor transporter ATP-binding protein EcfA2